MQRLLEKLKATQDTATAAISTNSDNIRALRDTSIDAAEVARQEMQVQKQILDQYSTMRQNGTLQIHNKMGRDQQIYVNGTLYQVPAGSNTEVTVPVGTVTTQLLGYGNSNWTVGAPDYRTSIDIVPQQTVFRPFVPGQPSRAIAPPVYYRPSVTAYDYGWNVYYPYYP